MEYINRRTGHFLAAYTAVKLRGEPGLFFLIFLAAYTAVKLNDILSSGVSDFLAAYTAVKERCYSSTP